MNKLFSNDFHIYKFALQNRLYDCSDYVMENIGCKLLAEKMNLCRQWAGMPNDKE